MRLSSLQLVNYRRYRDAKIEFPEGLIGIVGRNGAGKSSLLEAILWSLFGHDAARTSKDLIKRQDAAPGEDVLVRLSFESDGHQYTVTRRLRGKQLQPEAAVEADGTLLVSPGANSWDQANQAVERLLGFDRASFESTVVAKQGELAALSDLRPAQRKRLLLDMLGVERIESAILACRQEARLLEARLVEARRALDSEPTVRARLQEAGRQRDEAQARLADVSQRLAEASERARRERLVADRLLEARIRDQELRVRLQGLQTRLETIWTQRSRLAAESQILRERQQEAERIALQLQEFQSLDEELAAYERLRQAVQDRQRAQARLQEVDAELTRWRPRTDANAHNGSSPEHLEAKLAGFTALLEEHAREYTRLEVERVRDQHELQALVAPAEAAHPAAHLRPDDDCPVCERPLGASVEVLLRRREQEEQQRRQRANLLQTRVKELEALQAKARQDRTRTEQEQADLRRRLEQVRQRVRDADVARQEVARLDSQRAVLVAQVEALPERLDPSAADNLAKRRAERDRLRDQAVRAQEAARRLPRMRDEDRVLHAEEDAIVLEREKASRDLHQLGYPQGAWEQARAAADAAQRERDQLEREEVQWRERLHGWQRETDALQQDVKRLDEARQRVESEMARLKVLETVAASRGDAGILPEFKAHIVGRIRPALARSAAGLIRQMTEGRYSEVVLDEEYGVHLYDGAMAHPMERFSGGERDVTNLCLRLAVSELVANARGRSRLQFVALDEVFGSQDGERRDSVVRCLAGLSQVFRQVFVVTHLEDVRDRLEHVVRVEDGPDGTSRIVTVS